MLISIKYDIKEILTKIDRLENNHEVHSANIEETGEYF